MNLQKISPTDAGLEALLTKELGIIKENYTTDAQHLATNNLPAKGETFSVYWAEHHSKFENLITVLNQHLQSDALLFRVRQTADAASAEKQDLQSMRKDVQDALTEVRKEEPPLPDYNPVKRAGIRITVVAIALFEGLYTGPVFMQIGFNRIEASIASCLLAITLTAYYSSARTAIGRAPSRRQKRMVFFCMWLLPVIFFFFIGTGRADFLTQLSQQDGGEGITYSPWLFIITSIVMSTIALLLSVIQADKESQNQYKYYTAWKQKKKELETRLGTIEAQIKATDTNTRSSALTAAGTYELGHVLEQRVIAAARSGFEDFKKRIITRRTWADGPSMNEPYPMTFHTNFNYKSTPPNE